MALGILRAKNECVDKFTLSIGCWPITAIIYVTNARKHTKNDRNVTPHPLPKLKRPLYARLKEMGEFFPVVLWPLLKERKTLRLLLIALCLFLLSSLLYLRLEGDRLVHFSRAMNF